MRYLIGSVRATVDFAEVPNLFVWRLTKESVHYLLDKVWKGARLAEQDKDVLYIEYQLPVFGSWHQAEVPAQRNNREWFATARLGKELRGQVTAKEEYYGVRGEKMVLSRDGTFWFAAYEKHGGTAFETSILYKEEQQRFLRV
jgi:hypothetical protein